MQVRELKCWPPKWRGASSPSGHVAEGDAGTLIRVRWDFKTRSLGLTMEDEGNRYAAVLEGDPKVLTRLSLLLDWHVGRPLAKIGSLEIPL